MQRFLIIAGALLLVIGLLWPLLARLGLGRLPGDIVVQREGYSVFVPITTCIVVSLVISLLVWLFRK